MPNSTPEYSLISSTTKRTYTTSSLETQSLYGSNSSAPATQQHTLPLDPFVHHLARNRARLQHLALARALPRRSGAAHDAARTVHGRVERARLKIARLGICRRRALENHGVVTHRAADESLLAGKGWRRALAHDVELLAAVLLDPREVVMVMHQLHFTPTEHRHNLAGDPLAA